MYLNNKRVEIRISEVELLKAEKVVMGNPEKYDSLSHYVRCAIVRLNREELKNKKTI